MMSISKIFSLAEVAKSLLLVTAFCALAGFMSAPPAMADKNPPKAIRVLYQKFVAANRQKDVNALMAHVTSDFHLRLPNGQVWDRHQTAAQFRQTFERMKGAPRTTWQFLNWSGNARAATVLGRETTRDLVLDSRGKSHRMVAVDTERDQFVRSAAGWKFKEVAILNETVQVDGKLTPSP